MTGIIVRNTLVTYDRENDKIGFWKTNCSELWKSLHYLGPPAPPPLAFHSQNTNVGIPPTVAPGGLPPTMALDGLPPTLAPDGLPPTFVPGSVSFKHAHTFLCYLFKLRHASSIISLGSCWTYNCCDDLQYVELLFLAI